MKNDSVAVTLRARSTWAVQARALIPALALILAAGCSKTEEKPAAPAEQPMAAAPAPKMEAEAPKVEQMASAVAEAKPAEAATAAVAAAAAPGAGEEGEKVFKSTCMMCHKAGVAGAPKFGDKADWGPRIKQGKDVLYKHALEGFKGQKAMMPPRGGNMKLKDEEVKAAVDYMVSQSQ